MPATLPLPAPLSNANRPLNRTLTDGEFYDDGLPPELFDREEDMEDLQAFMHVVPLPDEVF